MSEPTIQFCFENQEAASNAFETLDSGTRLSSGTNR